MTTDQVAHDLEDALLDTPEASTRVLMQRVHKNMPAIGKDHRAPAEMGGYAFRGIEDLLAALNPLLGQHDLHYTPEVIDLQRRDVEGRRGVQTETLIHVNLTFHGPAEGDDVEMDAWGEARGPDDKGVSKATTNAIKNALLAWLALPTEEQARDDTDRGVADEIVNEAVRLGYDDEADRRSHVQQFAAMVRGARDAGTVDATFLDHLRQTYGATPVEVAALTKDQILDAYDALSSEVEKGTEPFEPQAAPDTSGAGVPLEQSGKHGYENWRKADLADEIEARSNVRPPESVKHDALVTRLRLLDGEAKAAGQLGQDYVEPDERPY